MVSGASGFLKCRQQLTIFRRAPCAAMVKKVMTGLTDYGSVLDVFRAKPKEIMNRPDVYSLGVHEFKLKK